MQKKSCTQEHIVHIMKIRLLILVVYYTDEYPRFFTKVNESLFLLQAFIKMLINDLLLNIIRSFFSDKSLFEVSIPILVLIH